MPTPYRYFITSNRRVVFIIAFFSLFVINLWHPLATAETRLEIFSLKHLSAKALIPTIAPLAGPDAVITSSTNKLIVRAASSNLAAIRALIDEIDIPQRMVLVSVRQLEGNERYRNDISTPGIMALEVPAKGPKTNIHTRQYSTRNQDYTLNQVQTIEGRTAYIYLGRSMPYDRQQYFVKGRHTGFSRERGDRLISRGFYVIPRIRGDIVELEVSSLQQRLNNDELETLEGREVSTIVNGRLGEWIGLGAGDKGLNQTTNSTIARTMHSGTDDFLMQIKVDIIHKGSNQE